MNRESVEVQCASDQDCPAPQDAVRDWALAAIPDHCHANSMSIRFVNDVEGRLLNRRFAGKNYATNVLAFESDIADYLGDIAICSPVAAAEASGEGKDLRDHIAHLVVHGTLHLCGFVHNDDESAAEMEQQEVRVLDLFGIRNPYTNG